MRREPVRTLCTERALECGAPAPHGGGWSYPFTKRASDRPRLLCPPPSTVRHALCVAMASTVSNLKQYDTCQRLTAARGCPGLGRLGRCDDGQAEAVARVTTLPAVSLRGPLAGAA